MSGIIPISVTIVEREDGRILVGKRIDGIEDGLYGFPGGKIDFKEPAQTAAVRELYEETNLTASNVSFLAYIDEFLYERHMLALMFYVREFTGDLINKEPNKCEDWVWETKEFLHNTSMKTKLMDLVVRLGVFDIMASQKRLDELRIDELRIIQSSDQAAAKIGGFLPTIWREIWTSLKTTGFDDSQTMEILKTYIIGSFSSIKL